MGQFEKNLNLKGGHRTESLDAATELNERLQGRVQNILLFLQKLIPHPES